MVRIHVGQPRFLVCPPLRCPSLVALCVALRAMTNSATEASMRLMQGPQWRDGEVYCGGGWGRTGALAR